MSIISFAHIFYFSVVQFDFSHNYCLSLLSTGQYTADEDNAGPITFWPSKGSQGVIKKHFFPFLGQPNYMSPLVFIKFEEIQTNVLVQVMCRPTNLLNVKTDGKELQGKIHFEVYLKNA